MDVINIEIPVTFSAIETAYCLLGTFNIQSSCNSVIKSHRIFNRIVFIIYTTTVNINISDQDL